ncbi:hypothetical protein C2W62_16420 [Candidatus Entotheonella serta]|nr:hypothetical protein C2W62_16420 [Candidatus Entotheonella serta]
MQVYPLFVALERTNQEQRESTTSIVSLGLPRVAEELMTRAGLDVGTRTSLKFHGEVCEAASSLYIKGVGIWVEGDVQFLVGVAPN